VNRKASLATITSQMRHQGRAVRLVIAIACGMAAPAQAQIGGGWTRLTLTQDYIDTQSMGQHARHPVGVSFTTSGARYEKTGDAETFELYDPSFNRVEHDTNYHYRMGSVQFEGFVQIYPGVNHQFIIQNFNAAGSGPIMALSAYSTNNGRIVKQGGSVEVASNVFGKEVRVNIIHDLEANTLAVYIDGKQAWAGGGGKGGGGFNFKYGSYGSLNGSTSAKARWRNVRFWTGGTASGNGPNPDPTDAAAADTGASTEAGAVDVATIPDAAGADAGSRDVAAAPDRTYSKDVGVSADRAPAGGGGSGGGEDESGGSGGVEKPSVATGCSCRLAGAPRGGAAMGLAALIWLWRVGRRSRRARR